MLVDSPTLISIVRPVADNVSALSENDSDGAVVYLIVQDGSYVPGLYIKINGAWNNYTPGNAVT